MQHFVDAARAGADALAASVFHYGTLSIAEVKRALADAGFPVRQVTPTQRSPDHRGFLKVWGPWMGGAAGLACPPGTGTGTVPD